MPSGTEPAQDLSALPFTRSTPEDQARAGIWCWVGWPAGPQGAPAGLREGKLGLAGVKPPAQEPHPPPSQTPRPPVGVQCSSAATSTARCPCEILQPWTRWLPGLGHRCSMMRGPHGSTARDSEWTQGVVGCVPAAVLWPEPCTSGEILRRWARVSSRCPCASQPGATAAAGLGAGVA